MKAQQLGRMLAVRFADPFDPYKREVPSVAIINYPQRPVSELVEAALRL